MEKRTIAKNKLQPQFRLRQATLKDLDSLVLQRHKMWKDIRYFTKGQYEVGDRAYRSWLNKKIRSGEVVGFLATDRSGKAMSVACVWLQEGAPRPGNPKAIRPYVFSVFTEKSVRRKGLASQVMKEAMKWCKIKGYSRMWLHASEQGRAVYQKLGWKRTWEMIVDL